MKKKILLFTSGEVGGAERITLAIAKILNKEYFDIKIIITSSPNCPLSKFVPNDIPVIYLSEKHIRWNCLMKIKKMLKEEKPDYAFSSITFVILQILIICKFFDKDIKPIIRGQINPHYWTQYKGKLRIKGWMVEKVNSLLYPTAYKVIAQTPTMKEGMIRYFRVKPEKCFCLYNPIDKNNIDIKIKDNNPFPTKNAKTYRYVAVGRCQYQKGYDLLIQAAQKVVHFNPDSHIYIIGTIYNDTYGNQLKELCKKLKLESNIHFTNFQTNPYKFIKYADCFVLSSRDEGLPNVLIEATYLQRQAIAYTCIPIITDIIQDGINGLLVEPQNIDKLAEAMIKIQSLNLNTTSLYKPADDYEFNNLFS